VEKHNHKILTLEEARINTMADIKEIKDDVSTIKENIKYLNASSRGTGTGSRNYVMFDDRFPTIVTRNGISLTDLLRNK
jgi:hypothetical protein